MTRTRVVVLLAVLLLGVAMGASAQATDSATLTLTGTVAASTAIDITPAAVASTLNLAATQTDLVVATMAYHSNDPDGFDITVDSTNNFALINAAATTNNSVAYTMRLTGGPVFVEATPIITSAVSAPTEETEDLLLSYTGTSLLAAGTFSDLLTFTITAN